MKFAAALMSSKLLKVETLTEARVRNLLRDYGFGFQIGGQTRCGPTSRAARRE